MLTRTNFASAWAYVRSQVERERPSLAAVLPDLFMRHMRAVLQNDLPHGTETPLLDWPLTPYCYNKAFFMGAFRASNASVHARDHSAAIRWLADDSTMSQRKGFTEVSWSKPAP